MQRENNRADPSPVAKQPVSGEERNPEHPSTDSKALASRLETLEAECRKLTTALEAATRMPKRILQMQGMPWPACLFHDEPENIAGEILELMRKGKFRRDQNNRRCLVALAGVPASGKSTLGVRIVQGLNKRLGGEKACLMPMDGFHYTREALDRMPDPTLAHERRGSEWTFDSKGLAETLIRVRTGTGDVMVPGFDHKLKDPTPDQHVVKEAHEIVVVEGLYLCMVQTSICPESHHAKRVSVNKVVKCEQLGLNQEVENSIGMLSH
mmetsp:Transcript_30883/g.75325  ORF Transcript_30883/g.75325 Transcript_30883/m.75325 type:complete len:267 (-) Transcript_30883:248-1048(-)